MSDTTPTTPEIEAQGPLIHALLTPLQAAIFDYMNARPYDGACRRDFALDLDVYEVANRIAEIEARLGIKVGRDRCTAHGHRVRFVRYSL